MRVLAIDSSGLTATVAVVEDTQTVAEYTINYKKTHSQTLLPMIDEVVKMTELDLNTIDAIAVAGGPGSFTGLRIGSATAKGLGFALNKPLIHVPTVDGLAYNVYGCEDIICPIMDARRNQVYTGIYTFSKKAGTKEGSNLVEPVFQVIKMQMAVSIEELAERLNRYRRREQPLWERLESSITKRENLKQQRSIVRIICVFLRQSGNALSVRKKQRL